MNDTQQERLNYLVEAFKKDSGEYRDLRTPADAEGKRRILRSLMNIRMPGMLPPDVLRTQDAYLRARAEEKGVVTLNGIPAAKGILSIWQGDITRLQADAIVNAANSQMLGCWAPLHNCIDNCIHSAAGIQLRQECYEQMLRQGHEEPTGRAKITLGYNLPSKHVIHTVGPIIPNGAVPTVEQDGQLASCYRSCLDIAEENRLQSIAFCCISTGVFNFPNQRAAEIAVTTVKEWLSSHKAMTIRQVIFNVFLDKDYDIYQRLLTQD